MTRRLDPATLVRGAVIAGLLFVALFLAPLVGSDWMNTL